MSNVNTSTIKYRTYQNDDLEGVLELWDKFSGWGIITQQQFNDWYMATPYGPCLVIVAENADNKISGQLVFVPTIVCKEGKEHKAYRMMAPIINPAISTQGIADYNHPTFAMLRFGVEQATKDGYLLFYSLPSIGWLKAFRTFPKYGLPKVAMHTYDCLQVTISGEAAVDPSNEYYFQPASFNKEYDQLWEDAVRTLPLSCAVAKNSKWLMWKRCGDIGFEMRQVNDHRLCGFIVIKKSALVVELLARTVEEMKIVLHKTIEQIGKNNINQEGARFKLIKFMQTPLMDLALSDISHQQLDFRFAAINFSLSDSICKDERWTMWPDD